MNLFDWDKPTLRITKPMRLIEAFCGIGAQAKALERLGVPFEHWRAYDIDRYAVASYNAIHGTAFEPTDICNVHAIDLGIEDTDRYEYILTYSFPCTDLSHAGRMAGMSKGSGTRSGLLWEVERILDECDKLPQILLMENVPQVVSDKNVKDFAVWCDFLENKGYTNVWEVLNARDYGVPQNRERCYMVSFLGEYQYEFPKPIPLERRMKDLLEDEVDEKYYIADEAAEELCSQIVHVEREVGTCRTECGAAVRTPTSGNTHGTLYSTKQTTMEQIEAWNSTYNPLSRVHGRESVSRCVTAINFRNNSGMVLYSPDLESDTDVREELKDADRLQMRRDADGGQMGNKD